MDNIIGFFPLLLLILSAFNLGHVIKSKLKLQKFIPWFSLGFFIILGVFQILTYFFVLFEVNTKLVLGSLLLIMLISICSPLIFKTSIELRKEDYIKLIIIMIAVITFSYIASYYGLGEKSDSVFYLSMVNENSVLESLGNIGFRGTETQINPMYAYQSFYHIFSMLIKLSRQFIYFKISPIYIYYWGAQILFYFVLFDIIVTFGYYFFKNKLIFLLVFIAMSLYLCSLEGFIYLAFIGNQWRVLCVSILLALIYAYSYSFDDKIFYLIGSLISSLIAVSSSGLYISIFISVGLWFVLVKNNIKSRSLLLYLLSLISLVLFIIIFANHLYGVIFAGLIIFCYILLLILVLVIPNIIKKFNSIIFIACFIFFAGYSLLFRNSLYPYLYFFEAHKQDMCNHYFSFYDLRTFFFNTTWIFYAFLSIIYLSKVKKTSLFGQMFFVVICLFLNPLVMPAVIKFLTDFVYYRSFDILFNIFTIAILLSIIAKNYNTRLINAITIFSASSILLILFNFWSHLSIDDKHTEETFDRLLKLNSNEIEVVEVMQEESNKSLDRPWVVSQMPYLKGYVNKIQLKFGVGDTRNIVKYSDRNLLQPQPSELMNIFIERDFIGQYIFQEMPNYDRACEVLSEEDVSYIIIKTDQFKEQDETWVPIWLDMRACNEVVLKNDEYVVLRRYK